MANTITKGKGVVMLSGSLDTDWLWTDTYPGHPNGLRIMAIAFKAAGADTLMLRSGAIDGPVFLSVVTAGASYATYLFGGAILQPCMDVSECSFTAGALFSICFST